MCYNSVSMCPTRHNGTHDHRQAPPPPHTICIRITQVSIEKIVLITNNLLDNVSHTFDNEFNIISHSKYCNGVDFKEMLQETN